MTAPSAADTAPVSLESLREAQAALAGVARRTPLVLAAPGPWPADAGPVRYKCEQLQPIGAFKIRGAYTAIRRLAPVVRARGVVTHSSGNHGIAVGWAARRLGVPAVVVVPADAPRVKLEAIRATGAELVEITDRALREPTAERLRQERGLTYIPPYDHPDVMAGQGTVGLEILEQCPEVETVLVPVSGGGFLGGVAAAIGALKPSVRLIGVEPEGAAKLTAALAAGGPARIERPLSMADGLMAPAIGRLPWRQMRDLVREAARVTEAELAEAVRFLWWNQGWRIEPSGAAAVAALLSGRLALKGPTVAVVSGGNMDPDLFDRLVPG